MIRPIGVLLVCLMVFAACGGGDGDGDGDNGVQVSGTSSEKPTIEIPDGDPPTELEIKDITEGNGDKAEAGDTVSVHYVGVSWSTQEQFDASWDRGEPIEFPLGQGMVIPGWDQGVEGMKVGGRRLLVIPPDLGYGPQGRPPAIGPNETLVFVVDLIAVESAEETAATSQPAEESPGAETPEGSPDSETPAP